MNIFNRLFGTWEELERQRFGLMSLSLIAQSCLGSVAAFYLFGLGLSEYIVEFSIVLLFNLGANVIAIAQLPIKWVICSFIGSILVSTFMIISASLT
ncbi:MAG: hypothetical protein AAF487_09740 [Bacteroidota bacterium]